MMQRTLAYMRVVGNARTEPDSRNDRALPRIVVGVSACDMTAVVTSPSGRTEQCMITEVGPSNYSIRFVPQEMGVHTVSVRHRNMHIPGKILLPLYLAVANSKVTCHLINNCSGMPRM